MTNLARLAVNSYESGMVQRYHTHPRLARLGQTDGHHQWGVAMLLLALHPGPSLELLKEAITHDVGERFAGDMPRPVKTQNPALAAAHTVLEARMREDVFLGANAQDLFETDVEWLHMLDALECICFVALSDPDVLHSHHWQEFMGYVRATASTLRPRPRVQISTFLSTLLAGKGCIEKSSVTKGK